MEERGPSLFLQVQGELLSDIIFKQFAMTDSRPTSAITGLGAEDGDRARLFIEQGSAQDSTPSRDEILPDHQLLYPLEQHQI